MHKHGINETETFSTINQPSFLRTNSRRVGPKTRICEKEAHWRSKVSRKRARGVTRSGVIPPVSYFSCKTDARYRYMYETTKKGKSNYATEIIVPLKFFDFLLLWFILSLSWNFLLRKICLGFVNIFFFFPVFWTWKCEDRSRKSVSMINKIRFVVTVLLRNDELEMLMIITLLMILLINPLMYRFRINGQN